VQCRDHAGVSRSELQAHTPQKNYIDLTALIAPGYEINHNRTETTLDLSHKAEKGDHYVGLQWFLTQGQG
jgi:hypothetical protein